MKKTFEKLNYSLEDLKKYQLLDPAETASLVVNILTNYNPDNEETFFEELSYLMGGEIQPISNLLKQQIKDRMSQNGKWKYIGKSYFIGAKPENDYEPSSPYEVEVKENPYSYTEEGYARLLLKSGGADNERPITLRKLKDGRWLLWSDSILGLLTDIRPSSKENPWA